MVPVTHVTGRIQSFLAMALLLCSISAPMHEAHAADGFTLFESGQVRPLALSPDGALLFAANTPDNTLEIFAVAVGGLALVASVPVGLEPVAVAARTNTEVWVINHLSDSVSIVDLSGGDGPRVVRTLHVGDEPRDIVFGGTAGDRAFVTCAHRGQNNPNDPELLTPGLGRADVWVFDANALGTSLGGDELTIVTLFGDTPRALAVSPDGSKVYAAVFHSGNQTTVANENLIPDGGEGAGGVPLPNDNFQGITAPEVGLIVKWDGSAFRDELGRNWNSVIGLRLPDYDVFEIDANATPPVQAAGASSQVAGVGTILFNMVVNPISGKLYVSNTEALNDVRFEGEGAYASGFGGSTVRGHLHESSITVIEAGTATRRHLNTHIDYNVCCDKPGNAESQASLAFPLEMAVTGDGTTLFVSAFGSGKIGIFDTAELETGGFTPSAADHITLSGGGPTGLVLDESRTQLYVLTRFDNSISVVSTATGAEAAHVALHNPEPKSVVDGRPFLYDASLSSSHGDSACASCHIFGDFDSLAWDLGNPDGTLLNNPGPFEVGPFLDPVFHPMKGPMTTQSLRGMDNHGPMHWRGDRTGGNDEPSHQPNRGIFNEDLGFKKFNPAFVGLLGRDKQLKNDELQAFTDFVLQIMYPPNPLRNLDGADTASQALGRSDYFIRITDTVRDCNSCHVLNSAANGPNDLGLPPGVELSKRPGFFGGDGRNTFDGGPQLMKTPHLRNVYQKVGRFDEAVPGNQVRGYGYLHDGSVDTIFRFLRSNAFAQRPGNPTGFPQTPAGDQEVLDMTGLVYAFDTNLAPIVGQQVTRSAASAVAVDPRIDLMIAQADAGNADIVVKGIVSGEARGAVYVGGGNFETDRASEASMTDAALRALALTAGQELTYTAVPVSDGFRIGVDRDGDGFRDADEVDAGSDPADGASMLCVSTENVTLRKAALKDSRGKLSFKHTVVLGAGYDQESVQVVVADGGGTIFDSGVLGTELEPNRSGSRFKFKADKGTTGITRISVKNDKRVAGGVSVSLKTSDGWAPGLADETEATTVVTIHLNGLCTTGNATRVR